MAKNRNLSDNFNTKNITARQSVLAVVNAVMENGSFLNDALSEYAYISDDNGEYVFDRRDRAFIKALSEGTIERCITIDYIINQYSSKPVNKLKPYIRGILRMSVYQILYMDKVPDNAAVNEAVKLTVKKGYQGLKGFVNGVLRNIARRGRDVDIDSKAGLSVKYSMPEWIIKHFERELGSKAARDAFDYFLKKPDITVRPDKPENIEKLAKKLQNQNIEYKQGSIIPYALRITKGTSVSEIEGFSQGEFVVQDESSMLPAYIICEYIKDNYPTSESSINVLDMCAAPGGKVLYLAGYEERVKCIARDVTESKVSKIEENVKRLGIKNVLCQVADALVFMEEDKEKYDIIIADLPCSGLGVIAKKPDIKYNTTETDLTSLADIQKKMLDNAFSYVKQGGIIVFSTCTVNKKENEDNNAWFLEKYQKETSGLLLEKYIPEGIKSCLDKKNGIVIPPGKYDTDGFYITAFKKGV